MNRQEQQDLAIAMALGDLTPQAEADVLAMVSNDAELSELVRLVRSATESMRSDDTMSAPTHLREAAKNLMSSAAPSVDWLGALSRIVASLVPTPMTAVAGFRGPSEGGSHKYMSDAGTVHLMISPPEARESRWRVRGSIAANRGSANEVAVVQAGEAKAVVSLARVDADGTFRVELPRGVFDLYVRLDDAAMEIRDLRIG